MSRPARRSRPAPSAIVSLPFFPEGIDINPSGPGSILTDGGVTEFGTNKGAPLPASAFQSIQGFNDFNPNTNFHQVITAQNKGNQNGVVLFPGSAPLYKDTNGGGLRNQLVGGLGVSGDGVLQDDDVTAGRLDRLRVRRERSSRADQVKVRGVRLPFFKYNRNPHVPLNGKPIRESPIQPPLTATEEVAVLILWRVSMKACYHVYVITGHHCRRQLPRARADDQDERPHHFFHRFHQKKEGTPPPGKPRFIPHTDERAGFPRDLAGHLEQSATAGGIGYYVGGGVPLGPRRGPHRAGRHLGLG